MASVRPGDMKCFHRILLFFNSLFFIFNFHRYAGYHQNHFICLRGYVLVHPTLHIRKFPLYLVFGCAAHAYLIRDENKSGILCGKAVEFFFGSGEGLVCVCIQIEEEVSAPQRYAVYQDYAPGQCVAAQFFFFFYVRPFSAASFLMVYHSFAETLHPIYVP